MRKQILFAALVLASLNTIAQVYSNNINGSKLLEAYDREGRGLIGKGSDIIGSPFLSEGWGPGSITFANGQVAELQELNFDQYINKPLFRKNNEEQTFSDPVKELRYTGKVNGQERKFLFRNGYAPLSNQTTNTYYQVLAEGPNFHLLRYTRKEVFEEMVNIGQTARSFKLVEDYIIHHVSANTLLKVPKSKKELYSQSTNFSSAIAGYLDAHKGFNPKSESDLLEMVTALNK